MTTVVTVVPAMVVLTPVPSVVVAALVAMLASVLTVVVTGLGRHVAVALVRGPVVVRTCRLGRNRRALSRA